MFKRMNDEIYRCCEENSYQKPKKTVKSSDFLKTKFANSLWLGRLALFMPKPDKNDAFKRLILGH